MESKSVFSSDAINYIQRLSKKFVKKNLNEEMIFFDGIWEVYEFELKKWINEPSKKWRFKSTKTRLVKILGMSGKNEALELITPTIIEILTTSFINIYKIKENLSLERIEETIKNCCGNKLSDDDRFQTISFFAPRIFQDLSNIKGIPVEEIKEKNEYKVYSHKHPPHKYPEGEEITKSEYSLILEDLESQKDDYLIQINEKKNEFLIWGKVQKVPEPSLKTLKILVKNINCLVKYNDIFKEVSSIARNNPDFYGDYRDNVQGYVLELNKNTNRKLSKFIVNTRNKGYSLILKGKYKYCLIEIFNDQ